MYLFKGIRSFFLLIILCFYSHLFVFPVFASPSNKQDGIIKLTGDANWEPYQFINSNGQPDGFFIDVIEKIFEGSEKEYQINLYQDWAKAQDDVADGTADAIIGFVTSEERAKRFEFSKGIITIKSVIAVRNDNQTVSSIENLYGTSIGLIPGTPQFSTYSGNERFHVVSVSSERDGIIKLDEQKISAFISDELAIRYAVNLHKIENVKIVGKPTWEKWCVIGITKGKTELINFFDERIQALEKSGDLDTIKKHWFGSEIKQKGLPKSVMWILGILLLLILLSIIVSFVLIKFNQKLKNSVNQRTSELSKKSVELQKEIERGKKLYIDLKNSEERFALAMKFANDGVFDWNLEANEIYFSPGWKKILGYEEHEIKNEFSEWDRLTKPEDVKASWMMLNEVLEGKRDRFENEFQMAHKDGHWVDILSRANIIFNEQGKGVRVVGTHVDISYRKRMEKELRESEEKYRSMMEQFADPLYICSPELKIDYMNPAMIRRVGRDAVGEPCYSGLHGLSSKCEWCVFDKVVLGELIETNIKSPLDDRHYRITNMPIHNPDGTVSKMTIFRDITEYLQAVSEKEQAQTQLHQSQKLESIGNLAGGIAHDFNNILSSIIGFTELALDEVEKDTSIEDSLQEVYAAGKRARDLVKQILAFARQTEEEIKPNRVDTIAKEVLKLIRPSIPATIEIRQNIESNSLVMSTATQLHQVFMNLFTNAAYAMEDGGGILGLSLQDIVINGCVGMQEIGLKSGNYIQIRVSDTGVGIPPDIIGSIFEPYFTTKGPGEGSGMGLAMVHGIVEIYGGKITVDSRLGEGTAFTVYLPITKKSQEHRPYESADLPSGTERILFVDDELAIAKMGSQTLEHLGYSVTTRTSSVEALELFRTKPNDFDLVITDMTMPNMTGDTLAVELMKIRPDIPVILCTGYSKKISDESTSDIGIKAFAYKPIVKADLAKTVRKVLDEAKVIEK